MIEKLKNRWGLKNGWHIVVILAVFACTGFSILYLKRYLSELAGLGQESAMWAKWLFSLFVVLPLYQVVLLIYGWLFGQFDFFWNFEKRFFGRITRLFPRK
jgi:amino acid transporter